MYQKVIELFICKICTLHSQLSLPSQYKTPLGLWDGQLKYLLKTATPKSILRLNNLQDLQLFGIHFMQKKTIKEFHLIMWKLSNRITITTINWSWQVKKENTERLRSKVMPTIPAPQKRKKSGITGYVVA